MKNVERRIRWIDIAKGIGILLVTVGHSRFGNGGWAAAWINSFHMPLFFVMAGPCFDETKYVSYWSYLKRKSLALVYPYIMLSLFVAILMTCFCIPNETNYFRLYLLDTFPGWCVSGFWFVRVLIVVEFLFALLMQVPGRQWILRPIVGLVLFGAFWHPDGYCFRANTILVSLGFYGLGYLSRPIWGCRINVGRTVLVALLCLVVQSALIWMSSNFIVGFGGCNLGNPVLFYPTAVLGIVGISCLSICIDSVGGLSTVAKVGAWLGKYSILLLAIHGACGTCRQSWCRTWPVLSGWTSQLLEIVLLFVLMWLLSGPLNFFMRMPRWRRLHVKR